MLDLNKLSPAALRAAMKSGTDGWGCVGSSSDHARYAEPIKSRRKCHCGCGQRKTHAGMANGIGLISGCELLIRRWVRDGSAAARPRTKEQS